MTFVKLDRGLLTSSLWIEGEADEVRVWIYLLLSADQDGTVDETLPAIAHRCRLTVERTEAILARFTSLDPHSRTPAEGGRRLEVLREPQWAIHIINFSKYRARSDPDERRRQVREAVRRLREKRKAEAVSHDVIKSNQRKSHIEREAEAEGETESAALPRAKDQRETWLTPYGEAWTQKWGQESEPPWGEMAKHLRSATLKIAAAGFDTDGAAAETLLRWRYFLEAAERAEWARPVRFLQGLGQWTQRRVREPPL